MTDFTDLIGTKGAEWFALWSELLTRLTTVTAQFEGQGATSTTSNAIGTGAKSFVLSAASSVPAGTWVVYSAGSPSNFMICTLDEAVVDDTAFDVTSQIAIGSGTFTDWAIAPLNNTRRAVAVKTADYTVLASDFRGLTVMNKSSAAVYTIPAASSLGVGFESEVTNTSAYAVTITPNAADGFDGGAVGETAQLLPGESLAWIVKGANDIRVTAAKSYGAGSYTIGKNIFVNGAMDVWQAGTGSATATAGSKNYLADQFYVNPSGANMAQARSTSVPTSSNKARYSLQVTGATSGTTCLIGQLLEAADVPMVKGYATFAWDVYNGTGGAFTPNLLLGTPAAEDDFTTVTNRLTQALQSCPDAAWTRVTHTVDISGYTNLAYGLQAELQIPSGSLDSGAKLVRVTLVQGELGRAATAFERLPLAQILLRCWRYYFVFPEETGLIGHGFADGNTSGTIAFHFPTVMRIEPTFAVSSAGHFQVDAVSGTSGTTTGLTAAEITRKTADLRPVRSGSTWAAGDGIRLLSNSTSAKLTFNARLA